MSAIRPVTLTFRSADKEQRYREQTQPRLRLQGQMAIIVGIVVYLLVGLLDFWFVPANLWADTWQARLTALGVPTAVLLLSLTPFFSRLAQLWLGLVSVAAGVGLIVIQSYLPESRAMFYYPAIILLTFYTYNFIGVRFVYALGIDVFLLLSYNLVFGVWHDYPLSVLVGHDIFIVSANLIGGTAGYLVERQRRLLFLRESELERERHFHFQRSLHDSLTGLPNRDLLVDRIGQALASSKRDHGVHCGLFLDLDGFKVINDRHGHQAGDRVLQEVADRLRHAVRDVDTVARLGGDEFFVLLVNIDESYDIGHFARKVLASLEEPFNGVPDEVHLGASIGICRFPYPQATVEDIIRRADEAMYDVKQDTKGSFTYS